MKATCFHVYFLYLPTVQGSVSDEFWISLMHLIFVAPVWSSYPV